MGACNTCAPNTDNVRSKDLRRAIEKQRMGILERSIEVSNINEDFYSCEGVQFTPLSYALFKGKLKSFKYMLETVGCSIDIMEQKLEKQGTSGLKIIAELGYMDLLDYCISYYLSRQKEHQDVTVSVDFSKSVLVPTRNFLTYTAVHIACENGHMHILNYLKEYFEKKDTPPHEFDIHGVDDFTGENCAMIACRMGNFAMLKFLHEVCSANFFLRNKRHECCILVTISASRKRSLRSYQDCLVYLVEIVGLDLIEQHEEALLLAENPGIINYIESKLKAQGITTKKHELEVKNQIRRAPLKKSEKEAWLDGYEGSNFQIRKLIEEDQDKSSPSIISVINVEEKNTTTPFVSTLIPFQTN